MSLPIAATGARWPARDSGVVVHFARGILGFSTVRDYRLTTGPSDDLFWLTSCSSGPRFLLVNPFRYFDDFSVELSLDQVRSIGASEPQDVAVLAITVPAPVPCDWTANLSGPLIINIRNLEGAQVILTDTSLGLRRPFTPDLPR